MPEDGNPERNEAPRRNPLPRASSSGGSANDEAVADMVAGCCLGDRGAQGLLYESFRRMVYGLMVRIVGVDEAPDLTQQAFLQMFRTIDQYSGRGRFNRWLYRLAVNEANQHLRRERGKRHHSLAYEPTDESTGGTERAERKDLTEQALARLDPALQSIFLLREIDDLSYGEIAEILDIPEGTAAVSGTSRLNSPLERDPSQPLSSLLHGREVASHAISAAATPRPH